jgi:L-ribulose-5-phosphate 4-epimerase
MRDELKRRVLEANVELVARGLVTEAWGNVSAVDRTEGVVVIKPSGVPYAELTEEAMSVVALDGTPLSGLKASSDTPTHLELYRAFGKIGGVAHTHSRWATVWAQAHRPLPCFGTTHADHFHGEVPCTRPLTDEEVAGEYERATGLVIVEAFARLDPEAIPAVLVAGHGPFAWGASAADAVENAAVLEEVACTAYHTLALRPEQGPLGRALLDKHYRRKHGADAYYGQG